MRYQTAVRRVRTIAETCHRANFPGEEPLLLAAYAFGEVLDPGNAEIDAVRMAFVLDRPAAELTWYAEPRSSAGLPHLLEIDKAAVLWFWRPAAWPVANHVIRRPLRVWTHDGGPDTAALEALARREADGLRQPEPSAEAQRAQLAVELDACLAHLRGVDEGFWERDWRSAHKGFGVYPENHLWNAVHGYLELLAVRDNQLPHA